MLELTKDNYDAEVLEAKGTKIFVDYFGDGCVPCKALMPHVHEFAETYANKGIKFCSFNTTAARRLAIREKIMGLPVMRIYENGQIIDQLVKDECTVESIENMIKKHIG